MTVDRKKLRELAMAARTRHDWEQSGDKVVYRTINALVADLADGMGQPDANAAFIAAAHPGAIIELLDALEKAGRDRDANFKVLAHHQVERFPVVNESLRKSGD